MIGAAALLSLPLEPDADEARGWLLDELGRPVYQEARPTWFDLASQAFLNWLGDLLSGASDGVGLVGLVLAVLIIAAIIVAAFLVFGRPKALARSRRATAALFGEDDTRDSRELRASARRAAAAGDHTTAVQEQFRAIARALAERTIVDIYPGMTARGLARAAAPAFPSLAGRLADGAVDFEQVRYLERPGTAEQYERLVELDRATSAATPANLASA